MIVFIKTILFSFSQNRMDFLLSTMNQRNHQSRFYNLRNNLENPRNKYVYRSFSNIYKYAVSCRNVWNSIKQSDFRNINNRNCTSGKVSIIHIYFNIYTFIMWNSSWTQRTSSRSWRNVRTHHNACIRLPLKIIVEKYHY